MTSLSFLLLVTPKKKKLNPYFSPKSSVEHKTPSILKWGKSDKQQSVTLVRLLTKISFEPTSKYDTESEPIYRAQ